jgi:5'-deoxynucleotidase
MGQVFIPGEIEKYELCVILYLDPKRRKKGMSHFFAYMNKLKHIKRWSLMRNSEEENVKEHSFDVAMIAHALAVIDNTYFGGKTDPERVMALALFHETGEVITGDLPTPVKYYNSQIHDAYKEVEEMGSRVIFGTLPDEMKDEYHDLIFHDGIEEYVYVKEADKLCAYIKCLEELKSGNREFMYAADRIRKELDSMDREEVRFFMKEFLPSYELTLDELNK